MRTIDVAGFEKKFRVNIDPWNYTHSRFEWVKRQALLRACGPSKHGRVLELGCAIGETTRALAKFSMQLVAIDASQTALNEAERRTPRNGRIQFSRAILPHQMPRGPFDLIVVSELIYYLRPHHLKPLAEGIIAALAPGGTTVVLNHRRPFDDAAVPPALAHRRLRRLLASRMIILADASHRHFDLVILQRRSLTAYKVANAMARAQMRDSGSKADNF